MTQPLAVVFYENILPGRQVENRLSDLGYRVLTLQKASTVVDTVRRERPMVLIADLAVQRGDFCQVIADLKRDPETTHVPVLGFTKSENQELIDAAVAAGAKLVADDAGFIDQLPQLLDHVLALE